MNNDMKNIKSEVLKKENNIFIDNIPTAIGAGGGAAVGGVIGGVIAGPSGASIGAGIGGAAGAYAGAKQKELNKA